MRNATLGKLLCGLALGAATRAQAQLSLAQAQRLARQSAPEAAALQAQVQGAQGIARDARRVLRSDPTLELRYGSELERSGEQRWGAGLSWALDVSGSWGPRAAAAADERDQAAQQARDGLRALDETVAIAVAELAYAQRQHERAARVSGLQEIVASAARRQLELGEANQLEDDGAQLDRAAARAELARAASERERAALQLARLIGSRDAGGVQVEDPAEQPAAIPAWPSEQALDQAPAVAAASSAASAARHELALQERLAWSTPTLGLEFERERRAIPAGAFASAPGAEPSARASWSEWQLGVRLELPLPLVDRNRERCAQAQARVLATSAQLAIARADARAELMIRRAELSAATQAYRELANTAAVLERSYGLLEQAARAGALDAVARAQALQRLSDAGRRLDSAVRDLRVARARFARSGQSP